MNGLRFVVVSGPPGSGKSTIAPGLARSLGLPLFAKDTIKEALMDALGVRDADESRRLGLASIGIMFALARENGCGVLESNWRASVSVDDLRRLPGPIVEVFCKCASELSRERHASRRRHRGHFDAERADEDALWLGEASRPIGGGWPLVEVDTSTVVDLHALRARIATLSTAS